MKKLDKVFKAGVVAVGVVTAGAAGAACDSTGTNCWSTSTTGNSSASAAVSLGGVTANGGSAGDQNVDIRTPRNAPGFGVGSVGVHQPSDSPLVYQGGWSFSLSTILGGVGGAYVKKFEYDEQVANWLSARDVVRGGVASSNPALRAIAVQTAANASPAVKAAVDYVANQDNAGFVALFADVAAGTPVAARYVVPAVAAASPVIPALVAPVASKTCRRPAAASDSMVTAPAVKNAFAPVSVKHKPSKKRSKPSGGGCPSGSCYH